MIKVDKYAQDGVNIAEGDSFSAFAGRLCQGTFQNSHYVEVMDFSHGHYRGPRGFRLKNLPDGCFMDIAPDGDGTKPVLIDAAGDYENAAYGWVAMTCGDVTRWGGLPLVLVNNLDVSSLGEEGEERNHAFRQMMVGLGNIASKENLVMFKGETAELGPYVGSENPNALARYLWSGVAFGVYHSETIITGDTVEKGMVVMALREQGFRNNGISSVRKALEAEFGPEYFIREDAVVRQSIRQAACPAKLYDTFLATLNGWFHPRLEPVIKMHLIVHVTGGAIKSKLAEDILFPRGLSADLDTLWEPPAIMEKCAEWRGMSDEDCYAVWNGGQGALVVISERDVDRFRASAEDYGISAKVAGRITQEATPTVRIHSKFNGDVIEYTAE